MIDKNNSQSSDSIIQTLSAGDYKNLPKSCTPIGLSVSYDMGWQKRSSGKNYDSLSGHGFFVGCKNGRVISKGVLKKHCAYCKKFISRNLPVPPHECNINHDGSAGSMESMLCLQLLTHLHDSTKGAVYVKNLVTDDDSTLRKWCSSNANGGQQIPATAVK